MNAVKLNIKQVNEIAKREGQATVDWALLQNKDIAYTARHREVLVQIAEQAIKNGLHRAGVVE